MTVFGGGAAIKTLSTLKPAHNEPYLILSRQWIPCTAPKDQGQVFRVMQWNVLAQVGTLAIVRYIQITRPFSHISKRALIASICVTRAYEAGVLGWSCFNERAKFYYELLRVYTPYLTPTSGIETMFVLAFWPYFFIHVVSTIVTILTVIHLCFKRSIRGAPRDMTRVNLKIFLTNITSIIAGLAIIYIGGDFSGTDEGYESDVEEFFVTVPIPLINSILNPIIFLSLTPDRNLGLSLRIRKEPRVAADQNSTANQNAANQNKTDSTAGIAPTGNADNQSSVLVDVIQSKKEFLPNPSSPPHMGDTTRAVFLGRLSPQTAVKPNEA
eukprot:sb/3466728/